MKAHRKQKRFKTVTNSLVIYSRESMGICEEKRVYDYFWMYMPSMNSASSALKEALLREATKQPRKWAIKVTAYCKGYAKHTEIIVKEPVKLEYLEDLTEQARQETINECNHKDLLDVEWIATPYTKEPTTDEKWENIINRVNNHDKNRTNRVA